MSLETVPRVPIIIMIITIIIIIIIMIAVEHEGDRDTICN